MRKPALAERRQDSKMHARPCDGGAGASRARYGQIAERKVVIGEVVRDVGNRRLPPIDTRSTHMILGGHAEALVVKEAVTVLAPQLHRLQGSPQDATHVNDVRVECRETSTRCHRSVPNRIQHPRVDKVFTKLHSRITEVCEEAVSMRRGGAVVTELLDSRTLEAARNDLVVVATPPATATAAAAATGTAAAATPATVLRAAIRRWYG
mmetsp:Transcript_29811/g.73885  ORF Transcript_29811/g.73885 Transcript_29811/m.73885 type:complete len:208 (+) Transcript_29811:489-1112(+)